MDEQRPSLHDQDLQIAAMQLVSSAENSSLDWEAQYGYIEDIGDGRGYTAGIIGFTTGTGDLLDVVRELTTAVPDNALEPFIPALERAVGSDSHDGLGMPFVDAWHSLEGDAAFRIAQDAIRDRDYFDPAIDLAVADGLGALGQFIYYDAAVVHGVGAADQWPSMQSIRSRTLEVALSPALGGDEATYLDAFLDIRVEAMHEEAAHDDTTRIDTQQRLFLDDGNLDLDRPLRWQVYGDPYEIE